MARRIDDVLHVLARADVRRGCGDVVELGPIMQCTPDNFAGAPERRPAFLHLVLSGDVVVRYDVLRSQEGGRFHHTVTRHRVVEVVDDFPPSMPRLHVGDARRAQAADRQRYQFNIDARSLVTCLHALSGEARGPSPALGR